MRKTSAQAPSQAVRVLVVEDDERTQKALVFFLLRHGYAATAATDGQVALDILTNRDSPSIVLLDWEMPKLSGLDVCRLLRAMPLQRYIYIIMVTARDSAEDLLAAFAAGADDFLPKPADTAQLLARMRSGERVLALELRLEERIAELQQTLLEVSHLKRLLPICMYCKKVRDDGDYWQEIDAFIHERTGTDFSHGVCPVCAETMQREFARETNVGPSAKA
ncbi:MAG: response regulator [Chthoniobacteraceae bacterium]